MPLIRLLSKCTELNLEVSNESEIFLVLIFAADKVGYKVVFPSLFKYIEFLLFLGKVLTLYLDVFISVKQSNQQGNGFFHILSRDTSQWSAFICIILAVDSEETAQCYSER